jgi:hypothetical protein
MIRGGSYIEVDAWRGRHWAAAVTAAGLDRRPPYALRHTLATFAIGAGVSLFELARFMGTIVEQIDRAYGHQLPDARERTRIALDTFVAGQTGRDQGGNECRDRRMRSRPQVAGSRLGKRHLKSGA